MGHLINSTSMRIGWFNNWSDSWYFDHVYYPEFLYITFRIRFFLVYLFTFKKFEKCGYFYSHFEIINYYNSLYIHIFFYDGFVEGAMDDLFFDHSVEVKKLNYKRRSKRRYTLKYEPWKMFVVFNWMHRFHLYGWSKYRIEYLVKALHLIKVKNISRFFKQSVFSDRKSVV